ncbi:type III-B CRISPR module RAMP protein Cmr6 [Arhodomonas sp. AD133]|uniref:type III-B CRISPR module RAMP protein Cmr6 n=1 Tax=Arhodomonas sp. AD133 TaxID=3415009 RepID=UPI003EBF19F6
MAGPINTARAAVPAYLGNDFRDAAPGHRFFMYLRLWDREWNKLQGAASDELVQLTHDDRARMKALANRQRCLAEEAEMSTWTDILSIPARSHSPFTTGLGLEHPLENGFTFLTPYGLPYLPGSSVKGVLRQAARELDEGSNFELTDKDWHRADIDALFGSAGKAEDPSAELDRRRGALAFWDVIPVIPDGANLQWEVMTPHHGAYYRDPDGGTPPHENTPPLPISFLTIPVGSQFRFVVQCNRALLRDTAPHLLTDDHWQTVTQALMAHAFSWLGFGAKTAVGYGEMAIDEQAREEQIRRRQKAEDERKKQAARAAMAPGERLAADFLEHKSDPGQAEYRYLLERLDAGEVPAHTVPEFADVVLRCLDQRRSKVKGLKNKKKREKLLEELDRHEQRLNAYARGDGHH